MTPDKSSDIPWVKEFTTHPQVASWANKTSGLAAVFATYSQGESIAKAIDSANSNGEPKQKRFRSTPGTLQPCDAIKVGLARALAVLVCKYFFLSNFLCLELIRD